jgi:hypothetical protein
MCGGGEQIRILFFYSFVVADFTCNGSSVRVEADYEPDVTGFAYPDVLRVFITKDSGKTSSVEISYRDLQTVR